MFKEEFLKLALKSANAKAKAFNNPDVDDKTANENVRISNQAINKLKKLYLRAKLDGTLHEIEDLMFHENKYVRHLAATYSLVVNPELAEKTLKDLIELPVPNMVGVDASLSLEIWRKGHL